MSFKTPILSTVVTALLLTRASALDNGLAITPQMGWDNWNAFGCSVSQDLLTATAQLIVDYQLKDLGYQYVILDDCWSSGRNASNNNSLIADSTKFPNGMKAVADDLHSLGLKFGMYSDAGKYTCGGFPGSLGYEDVDAKTWAGWGVDYLKYDNCYNEGQAGNQQISQARYATMQKALNATGRSILYSLCNWGEDYPWNWGSTTANSWRISGDVFDDWDSYDARCPCDGYEAWNCGLPGFHCSVTNIINKAAFITSKSQPGAWNDLDMLEVGNGAMSDDEYIAHFSLWAALKSPLIMGSDIRVITPLSLSILSNPAIIALNQDPSGSSASRRYFYSPTDPNPYTGSALQMWSGSLTNTTNSTFSDEVVVLINGGSEEVLMNATLAQIFVDSGPNGKAKQVGISWEVRDLWANRMTVQQAEGVIAGNGTWVGYNATKTSYGEGLQRGDERLLGNVTGVVRPSGTVQASVQGHGARVFRLRPLDGGMRKRDEL